MNQNIIDDLKAFDWQTIIEYGNSLDDLNDSQWRFIKGLAVELCVEKYSNSDLTYVGVKHKDFNWPTHNITAELKSQLSGGMYGKKGRLKKNYTIKLNNSHGTNNQKTINPADVADVIIVVRDDGAFAIDKATAIRNARAGGDGFEVKVTKDEIVELSGLVVPDRTFDTNLKHKIATAVQVSLP
jgi:hypothetical protein